MLPHSRKRKGFSLTELLVVIGLIGILGTAMGVAMTGSRGRALAAAQREVMSSLNVARIAAIKGSTLYPGQDTSGQTAVSALVINVDRNSPGYLREFGVIAGWRNASNYNSSGMRWRTVGKPLTLPDTIYFVTKDDDGSVSADSSIETSGGATLTLSYPMFQTYRGGTATSSVGDNVSSSVKTRARYYCIFFDADGTISAESPSPNSTSSQNIIMAYGEKTNIQASGTFSIEFPEAGQATGVRTVRYGNPIPIIDPEDLSY